MYGFYNFGSQTLGNVPATLALGVGNGFGPAVSSGAPLFNNGDVVIPTPGVYLISYTASVTNNAPAGNNATDTITISAAATTGGQSSVSLSSGAKGALAGQIVITLNANDHVKLMESTATSFQTIDTGGLSILLLQ
jgi:hypothetical protein